MGILDGKLFMRDHVGWYRYMCALLVEQHCLDPDAAVKTTKAATLRLRSRIGTYDTEPVRARRHEALLAGHELCIVAMLKKGDEQRAIDRFLTAAEPDFPTVQARVLGVIGTIHPELAVKVAARSKSQKAKNAAGMAMADRHLRREEYKEAVAVLDTLLRDPAQCCEGVRYAVTVGTQKGFADGRKAAERWLGGFLAQAKMVDPMERRGIWMRAAIAAGYLKIGSKRAAPLVAEVEATARSAAVRTRAYALPFLAYLRWTQGGDGWKAVWKEAVAANAAVIDTLKKEGRYGLTLRTPLEGLPDPNALADLVAAGPAFATVVFPEIPDKIDEVEKEFLQGLRLELAIRHDAVHEVEKARKMLADTKTGLVSKGLQRRRLGLYVSLVRARRFEDE
jgi:hypothetical protein